MFFANSFNFFILIFQFILQFYCIFMFITNVIEFFMFNDKIMIDFLEQLNNLYKKYKIIENNQKIHCFFYYYNVKHVNMICLFFKYACKN